MLKAPKVYVRDSGILHALLGLRDATEVLSHSRFGFSWEGFALEHVIAALRAEREACFWATHAGAELDAVVPRGGKVYGFECMHEDRVTVTQSMRIALEDLGLERLFVVVPVGQEHELMPLIHVLPLPRVAKALAAL